MLTKTLRIGILCPHSSIFPNLNHDFLDGLKSAMPNDMLNKVQFFPEFINLGGTASIDEAINRLISFHNVEVITGYIGYRHIPHYVPLIERARKLAIFAGFGEYVPHLGHVSDNIFYSGQDYWQAEYALGYWAQKQFEGKGLMTMSLYESGYQMHTSFREGYYMAGAPVIDEAVIPVNRIDRDTMNKYFEDFLEMFRKEKPAFLHSLFSGHEAVDFIGLYAAKNMHKEVPLLVSPHMASPEVLHAIKGKDITFYSGGMWGKEIDTRENKAFQESVMSKTGLAVNEMVLSGYEVGLGIKNVFRDLQKGDVSEACKILKSEKIRTPRGDRNYHLKSEISSSVFIEKVVLSGTDVKKIVVEEGRSPSFDHTVFSRMNELNESGWQNPYLCV